MKKKYIKIIKDKRMHPCGKLEEQKAHPWVRKNQVRVVGSELRRTHSPRGMLPTCLNHSQLDRCIYMHIY